MIVFGITAIIGAVMIWTGLENREYWWVPFGIILFMTSMINIALLLK